MLPQHPTLATQEAELVRHTAEHQGVTSTKLLIQQQQVQQQQVVTIQEAVALAAQTQRDQQQEREEKEHHERELQRQKVIEDHQKQKNSNRIFSNSTKNITNVTNLNTNAVSVLPKSAIIANDHASSAAVVISSSPAEHGFRKVTGG